VILANIKNRGFQDESKAFLRRWAPEALCCLSSKVPWPNDDNQHFFQDWEYQKDLNLGKFVSKSRHFLVPQTTKSDAILATRS
jgi:hypothetical protein